MKLQPANNTAYALRSLQLLDLRDFAPFGRNVVYAGNVKRNGGLNKKRIHWLIKEEKRGTVLFFLSVLF